VKSSHTDLTEVTRVVLVDVCSVMVLFPSQAVRSDVSQSIMCRSYLTTSHTATTGVLSVLSYTTMSGADMATVFPCLREASRHIGGTGKKCVVAMSCRRWPWCWRLSITHDKKRCAWLWVDRADKGVVQACVTTDP